LTVVQQKNLKLNQLLLADNSEEWNDDELDLYESIFSAKEQMTRSVWTLVRALKNTIQECDLYETEAIRD